MHAPPVTGTRRFECTEGSSSKFWEITLNGMAVSIQFGRIGTQGQTNSKSFPEADAATKHVAKQIADKLRRGYREIVA